MIGLWPTTTIFLATAPTDLRKAYDGLAALVRQSLGQDPLNGSLYVFCNRRKDRIKILFWEEAAPAKRHRIHLQPTRLAFLPHAAPNRNLMAQQGSRPRQRTP